MIKGMSVRGRLLLTVTLLLSFGFMTTSFLSFRVSSEALKSNVLHSEMPLTSSNIYSEIQADLLRPIFVSSLMSNDTFLRDWLLDGEKDTSSVTRYLDAIKDKYGIFTTFVVSDKTRNYYHFSGLTKQVKEGDWRDIWFFRAKAMDKPYEINIDYNEAQQDVATIFINYKLDDYQGHFLGVTGVGLQIDSVARIVARYRQDYQRNVYFIDPQGRVKVHSSRDDVPDITSAPGLKDIAPEILATDSGFFEYRRADGETVMLTTRLIPELGWRVMVERTESGVIEDLRRNLFVNIAIGTLVILLTMGLIAYTINLYHRRLEDMATTDKLTGIGNRQVFDFAISHALKLRSRAAHPLTVILLDIDHFKQVNDRYGHLVGDEVLQRFVAVVRHCVRQSDILCRWGGEEFILLAEDCNESQGQRMAETIRKAIADAPVTDPDNGLRVTISAGVAQADDGEDPRTLLSRVDACLYQAKAHGRNCVIVHSARMTMEPQHVS